MRLLLSGELRLQRALGHCKGVDLRQAGDCTLLGVIGRKFSLVDAYVQVIDRLFAAQCQG